MSKDSVVEFRKPEAMDDPLTELLRKGAKQWIQQAIEAELEEMLGQYAQSRDEQGRRAVVRNGSHPERKILTGIGRVEVKVPKVRSRHGESVVFHSSLVPPYLRKARRVEAALPWLYLKGISTGQMQEAREVLLGPEAKGLSPAVSSRLKRQWEQESQTWCRQDLSKDTWVYWWADGLYSGLRAEDQTLCALVIIGVNDRGEKHFLAIADGGRESTQSWREVLLGPKARGLKLPPKLAVGAGALGFWAALSEIYPETRHQRCWVHKTANVLNSLPMGTQPKAKEALREIWNAENRADAEKAFEHFIRPYQATYPKAVDCLRKDRDALLAFFDFPAEHWQPMRPTTPIESTFATIRHRTDRAKGCVSRKPILGMISKLAMCAEKRWCRIRGGVHLAKVIKGVKFEDGIEMKERTEENRNAA